MRLLTHHKNPDGYVLRVWLDSKKVDEKGDPDPEFVRTFEFALEPPEGVKRDEYEKAQRREAKALLKAESKRPRTTALAADEAL